MALSVAVVLLTLLVAQSFALLSLYEEMEEEFIDGLIDEQVQYSIEHSRKLGTPIHPQTPDMTMYRFPVGSAPPQGLAPTLAALAVGNHEDTSTGRELHVAVRDADGFRYVLVYDESDHLDRETAVATAVVLGCITLIALSLLLVYAIATHLTRGLERLAGRVRGERDGASFAEPGLDDELLCVARALDSMEARQTALLARERDFNSNLSHELRTPLASIRSDAEMLLADPSLSEKARRRAARIVATTDRTTQLARSLLLLARETQPQGIETVDLRAAVEEAWGLLQPGESKPASLILRMDAGARVDADATLLQLVLHNLLDNALKHGEGRQIEVSLDGSCLNVCDRGPGFALEEPERGFERFRRAGTKSGHGLGLAIVEHVCKASGWQVRAAHRPGGGACVSVDFGRVTRAAEGG